jgi:two-component system, NtrC family, sensor histidine kinase KinB
LTQDVEFIPLHREAVNVAVLIGLTTEIMERQASTHGVRLTVRIDDEVPDVVDVDRNKVAWVITNLLGSAMRHTQSPGGLVDLHVSYDARQSALAIAVRDNGPGISPERLKKLLDRRGWHPHAALALLLVEDIAIAHGGMVEIESEAVDSNRFTLIRVTIPIRAHFDRGAHVG